jgi:cyclopropane-fatty-acyl-phospholipid synthase
VGYQDKSVGGAPANAGASPEAIQFHYDVGTDFFRTWLGDELVYSAARWRDPLTSEPRASTLEQAQTEKLDFHLDAVRASDATVLLDIGCGWGGLIRRAVGTYGVKKAIGATLSAEQSTYVRGQNIPRTRIHLQSYEALALEEPVDAIVSIGAFEHFAKPGEPRERKVAIYRNFFKRCHGLMRSGARLSLQSIFWQTVDRHRTTEIVPSRVFPESDLPYLDEILEAAHRSFRTVYLETSEDDYARTLREWLTRLRKARKTSPHLVDKDKFLFHEDYLRRCIVGFARHRISLSRTVFERI